MKENQTNHNGVKSVYEPVEVQVCVVAPAGVLCQSGGIYSLGEETISDLF